MIDDDGNGSIRAGIDSEGKLSLWGQQQDTHSISRILYPSVEGNDCQTLTTTLMHKRLQRQTVASKSE